MAKLYFLGGENVAKRDAKEVNMLAFQDAGGVPSVLVFPWARPSFDVSFKRRKRLVAYFRSIGAEAVDFADYNESHAEIAAKIVQSDLIYLTGGQVSTLLSRLRTKEVDRLLRGYSKVVVGRSAGALVFGRTCATTNRYSGACKAVKGLGLVDFSVKVHYEPSDDERLRKRSKMEKVYGIPSRAAVIYEKDVLSFVGGAVLFENGEKILLNM